MCKQVTEYVDLLFSFGLLQLILKPTRRTDTSASLIDHIITNSYASPSKSVILISKISDHYPIIYIHSNQKNTTPPKTIISRNYSVTNLNNFKTVLQNLNWINITSSTDTQQSFDLFQEVLTTLFNLYFPLTESRFNHGQHRLEKWMTAGLLVSRREKIRLGKQCVQSPSPFHSSKFKSYRNLYNRLIRTAKKLYYESQFTYFQSNLKKSWSLLNQAINKMPKKSDTLNSITINNISVTDPLTIANHFNTFFTSVAKKLSSEIPPTDRPPDPVIRNIEFPFSFNNDPISPSEISKIIRSFEPKKTCDADGLSMFFISNFADPLSIPLSHIFSLSLSSGIIPNQLKIAKVIPIFKNGDSQNVDNYRPISLLNVFSKILERIVHKRLSNHLADNKLLSPFQFGFRKNISTIHPLTKFLNFIAKSNNNSEFAIALFCDLRKAFDTCDHTILLNKLKSLGVTGVELSWFGNYLAERKQFVSIEGISSNLLDLLIGVPQGSILGPLLFLTYINDLPECSKLLSLLFADDTTLLGSHKNLDSLVTFINCEFKKISYYFRQNKLSLHPKKTYFILFSPNRNHNPTNINIVIDNNNIPPTDPFYNPNLILPVMQITSQSPVPAVKFLGVFIDPKLDFKYHVNYVSGKISTAMYFLRTAQNFLTPAALKALYFTLVHCHLIYALPIWSCTTPNNLSVIIKKTKNSCKTYIKI